MEAQSLRIAPYRHGSRRVVLAEIDPAVSGQSSVVFGPDTEEACEEFVLSQMTDREAVGYWNILQFDARCLTIGDTSKTERHTAVMDVILTERGVAHERGTLTRKAA